MKKHLVITGDVVGFTKIEAEEREKLISKTGTLISSWVKKKGNAQIFRGDSFQLLFVDIKEGLRRSIQLRCWFKKNVAANSKTMLDAKIAIGIGKVSYLGKTVLDSDGEAFHLSGRTFDDMENDEFLRIVTADKTKNEQLKVILSLAEVIIGSWTANQAEVIYLLCEGKTQQQMADELQIAQSAVNNRIKLAKWKEIEKTIQYINDLINT